MPSPKSFPVRASYMRCGMPLRPSTHAAASTKHMSDFTERVRITSNTHTIAIASAKISRFSFSITASVIAAANTSAYFSFFLLRKARNIHTATVPQLKAGMLP